MANFKVPFIQGLRAGSSEGRHCRAALLWGGKDDRSVHTCDVRPDVHSWGTKTQIKLHALLTRRFESESALAISEVILAAGEEFMGCGVHAGRRAGDAMLLLVTGAEPDVTLMDLGSDLRREARTVLAAAVAEQHAAAAAVAAAAASKVAEEALALQLAAAAADGSDDGDL